MPRRAEIAPRTLLRDPVYDSTLVAQVINRVMLVIGPPDREPEP